MLIELLLSRAFRLAVLACRMYIKMLPKLKRAFRQCGRLFLEKNF
jgi:hypothetical protein